ncbi:MAG TPA: Ger(x)C family spore germination protein [Negativicutes bacterium]
MIKVLGIGLLVGLTLFIAGCWDGKELQDRHLVIAAAIDAVEEDSNAGEQVKTLEQFAQPHGNKRYRLSLQILDLSGSARQTETQSSKSPQTYVVSNTGESLLEMARDLQGQLGKTLYFEHIQSIILSEKVVKEAGLEPLTDWFRRESEFRSRTKVLITSGEARLLLEYKPPNGEVGGMFFANSARLFARNIHLPGQTDMGFMSQMLDNNARVIIPRIELADDVVKLGGLAVFKHGQLAGYLDEYATQGSELAAGLEKSAVITIVCPEDPNKIISYELFRHDTKMMPQVEGDQIFFTVDIRMEGNISENQCNRQADIHNPETIHNLERLFAEEVKNNIVYAYRSYQTLGVDGFDFAAKLKAHKPKVWSKVKGNWEEVLPTIPLVISVNVMLHEGAVRK